MNGVRPRLVGVCAAFALPAAAVAAIGPTAPPGVALDPNPPVAVVADAGRLAWLRPLGGGRVQLVVRDPGATPRAVGIAVPPGARQLALGDDALGHPTVVVSAPDRTKRGHRASLWAVRVDQRSASLRKLPVSRLVDGLTAPGLRDGVVSFVERGAGDLDGYAVKRLAATTLTSARATTVAKLGRGYAGLETQTVPVRGGRVLVAGADTSSAIGETIVTVRAYGHRDSGRVLVRSTAQTGDGKSGDNTGASGLGPVVLDATGEKAIVSRWAAATDPTTKAAVKAPRDLVVADIASGRAQRLPAPAGADIALALGSEGFAVFDADRAEYNFTPRPARDASGVLRLASLGAAG